MILIAQNAEEYEALKSFVTEKNLRAWVIPGFTPRFAEGHWDTSPMGPALESLLYEIQLLESPEEYERS